MTPCSWASASVVSASARAALDVSPRGPYQASYPERERAAAAPGPPAAPARSPPARAGPPRPSARRGTPPSRAGRGSTGSALSSARSSDCSRREPKSSHASRELVDPGQDDGESEGRADRGLDRPRTLSSSRPCSSACLHSLPPVTASTRPSSLRAAISAPGRPPARRGDRRAGVVGGSGQVGAQQEEGAGEALLDCAPGARCRPPRWHGPRGTARPPGDGLPRTPRATRASRGPRRAGARAGGGLRIAQQLPGLAPPRPPPRRRSPHRPFAGAGSPPSPPA